MEPDEAKVYTAICERYAVQFLPPAVYDVSESTVSVDGGRLSSPRSAFPTRGSRLSSRTSRTAASERIPIREPMGSRRKLIPCRYLSCSITEGGPPRPHLYGGHTHHRHGIHREVRQRPGNSEILKRKDDGKKGEHGGIGTTATRSSIIEGLKPVATLRNERGKVRATDKAKAFYALLRRRFAVQT